VEEQISVLRLIAVKKNGEQIPVLWASNAKRKVLFGFVDGFAAFRKTGSFPEKHQPKREACPRCGTPYEEGRRICKKCFNKRSLIKRVMPFFWRYKWRTVMTFVTLLLTGTVAVLTPYLNSKVLYDEVLSPSSPLYGRLLYLVASIAGVGLLGAVIQMLSTLISSSNVRSSSSKAAFSFSDFSFLDPVSPSWR
jgi:hypothetical protein